jgi:hypothetical protein
MEHSCGTHSHCVPLSLSLISLPSLKREPHAIATSNISGKDPSEGDQLGGGTITKAPAAPVGWLWCGGCGLWWHTHPSYLPFLIIVENG